MLAVRRRHLPEALELTLPSADELRGATHLSHFVEYNESTNYRSPSRVTASAKPGEQAFAYPDVWAEATADDLVVTYECHDRLGAPTYEVEFAPKRVHPDHTGTYVGVRHTITLKRGQWARIKTNGRCRDYDGSAWYGHWTFTVSLFSTLPPSVFLETTPDETYAQLAPLYGNTRSAITWE